MIYLDTSCVVRLYLEDPGFEEVRELAAADHVSCAIHGQVEAVAAFHRKLREGAITPESYKALLEQFEADLEAEAFNWLPASFDVLARVRTVYASLPDTVFLRGADALHLATAAVHGFQAIYSNDSHLLAAATHFNITGVNFIAPP